MEDKLKALCEELNSARVRISELTSENVAMEIEKDDLMGKIEELIAQKAAAESVSAEMVQEKESSDTEKGTKEESACNTHWFILLFYIV
jgi:regulator of replication initiation timing